MINKAYSPLYQFADDTKTSACRASSATVSLVTRVLGAILALDLWMSPSSFVFWVKTCCLCSPVIWDPQTCDGDIQNYDLGPGWAAHPLDLRMSSHSLRLYSPDYAQLDSISMKFS